MQRVDRGLADLLAFRVAAFASGAYPKAIDERPGPRTTAQGHRRRERTVHPTAALAESDCGVDRVHQTALILR